MSGAATAETLTEAYVQHRAALVAFFTARIGSAAEAEDLVQELFLKVAPVRDAEIINKSAYLYRLGLNLLIDRYRSDVRARLRERRFIDATAWMEGEESVSEAPSPERAADARLRLEKLLKAVVTLPPQCRRVFRMHKIEGRSHGEIAAELGISRSAVEKHIIAALRRLAQVED